MTEDTPTPAPRRPRRTTRLALIGAGLIGLGGVAGAVAMEATRPSVTMAPATPTPIARLTDDSLVTVRGQVAEVFGNTFIMADGSGRTLIDLGREGGDATLVARGQTVTVQGRYDRSIVRAAFLVGADGKTVALGPLGGRHDRGPGGKHGPKGDRGPDRDGPTPPPPADGAAPPPAPVSGATVPAAPPAATAQTK
ncbi:MAG: hypothetical protein V4537_08605 [Pseudomonadota bacterium]